MIDLTSSLPVLTFNAVGAMPNNRRDLGRRCLIAATRTRAALLLGVECDDLTEVDIDEILDPDLWWHRHRGPDNLDGALIAGRRDRTTCHAARWLTGAPASSVNAPRPILRARIAVDDQWSLTAGVAHFPRSGGGEHARAMMIGRTKASGLDLLAGDFNLRKLAVRRAYPARTIRSAEVMHVISYDRFRLSEGQAIDLLPGTTNDDHPGLLVDVKPAR